MKQMHLPTEFILVLIHLSASLLILVTSCGKVFHKPEKQVDLRNENSELPNANLRSARALNRHRPLMVFSGRWSDSLDISEGDEVSPLFQGRGQAPLRGEPCLWASHTEVVVELNPAVLHFEQ